jgi:hypothetical protein
MHRNRTAKLRDEIEELAQLTLRILLAEDSAAFFPME